MRQLLSIEHATLWNEWSATVFMAVFIVVFLWVYAPWRRSHYEQVSRMPLRDE